MKHSLYKTKKPLDRSPAVVSLIFRSQVISNYLADQQQLSQQRSVSSSCIYLSCMSESQKLCSELFCYHMMRKR